MDLTHSVIVSMSIKAEIMGEEGIRHEVEIHLSGLVYKNEMETIQQLREPFIKLVEEKIEREADRQKRLRKEEYERLKKEFG